MIRIVILFFLLTFTVKISYAQLTVGKINKKDIPASVKYTGHIIDAVIYRDNDGDHLVITTETGETPSKSKDMSDARDAELYAYHYIVTGNNYRLTWKVYDFVRDCPVDVACNFLPNTFAVTDLNNDGRGEVWLMYKTVCHGDVSPSTMKIIMHEGDKKYAVRGLNKVKVSKTQFEGGKYTFDDVFSMGPQVFRTYASNLWKKNLLETWK